MSEYAIQINGLKKQYRLGQIGGGTLTADLQSWWARVRGKVDPNSKIGQEQRLVGQTFMALNGIDLKIKKGEALGIIGGNGAGKSTMLKILSRITAPTEGSVDIEGRIASMLEVGTGFSGEMTGRENVYMNGAILGMTRAEIDEKMEAIIEFSEVRDFIDTPVKRYSSGMYVKLAFSVAAHLDAEIMIMDEVLAVGDMAFQKKCLDKMRDAATVEGKTVLYVSHNMNTIRKLCDRCIVLDKGKIIFEGDVEEAIEVYMHNTTPDMAAELPLGKVKRVDRLGSTVRMERLRFEGGSGCICRRNQKIPITLVWKGLAHREDIHLRILVLGNDAVPVGLTFSGNLGDSVPGQVVESRLLLDFPGLVEGQYCMTLSLYQQDALGNSLMLDTVQKACYFQIGGEEDADSDQETLKWPSRAWGAIQFPVIEQTARRIYDEATGADSHS